MKRVKLIVAYDGTNYHGWQTQPNAVTIEEVLNHHLSELLKEEIKVIGASRSRSKKSLKQKTGRSQGRQRDRKG